MSLRFSIATGLSIGLAVVTLAAQQDLTKNDATSMEKKLVAIIARGAQPPGRTAKPQRTTFTDREVNAYFKFNSELMPDGVTNPKVTIQDAGKVQAEALVNLGEALKSRERSWLDWRSYLTGTVVITANGTLQAANGMGTFAIETATFGGVPVPKSLLLQVVSYYSRSPELPEGFDLDKPFALPASIRAVETRRGLATIVQ